MRLITVLLTFLFVACGTSKDGDFTLFSVEEDLALGKELSLTIQSDPTNYPLVDKSKSTFFLCPTRPDIKSYSFIRQYPAS